MAEQKLRAFITAVTFADGAIHLNAMAVPDEVCAMVTTALEAGRRFEGPSTGYAFAELSVEFLRSMLRAIDDKPGGALVSLVPSTKSVDDMHGLEGGTEAKSLGQVAREFLERQPQQWPLSKWPTASGCLMHPGAPIRDGICSACHPSGGAA